jgi:hypothetical protein
LREEDHLGNLERWQGNIKMELKEYLGKIWIGFNRLMISDIGKLLLIMNPWVP